MNELTSIQPVHSVSAGSAMRSPARLATMPLPRPRTPVVIRPGTLADVPFMDGLQKLHTRQVGWMPRAQFEGKIKLGHVLVAEERVEDGESASRQVVEDEAWAPLFSRLADLPTRRSVPVGYCIGNDQYFKRDDVGIIYQMNVLPGRQRGFIGAALLKAMFERSAYGCKLYCCWCAQDIAANRFWEAMGFVPLAFRTGSRTKGRGADGKQKPRVHIFWQKRIREGDVTTPWWFPSQTGGGSIREDRIVLPIPPGVHWSDAVPMVLPGEAVGANPLEGQSIPLMKDARTGEGAEQPKRRAAKSSRRAADKVDASPTAVAPVSVTPTAVPPVAAKPTKPQRTRINTGGLRFRESVPTRVTRNETMPQQEPAQAVPEERSPLEQPSLDEPVVDTAMSSANVEATSATQPDAKRTKPKNDPRLVTAARELRDRWLEQVNGNDATASPLIGQGKYDVTRAVEPRTIDVLPMKQLAA